MSGLFGQARPRASLARHRDAIGRTPWEELREFWKVVSEDWPPATFTFYLAGLPLALVPGIHSSTREMLSTSSVPGLALAYLIYAAIALPCIQLIVRRRDPYAWVLCASFSLGAQVRLLAWLGLCPLKCALLVWIGVPSIALVAASAVAVVRVRRIPARTISGADKVGVFFAASVFPYLFYKAAAHDPVQTQHGQIELVVVYLVAWYFLLVYVELCTRSYLWLAKQARSLDIVGKHRPTRPADTRAGRFVVRVLRFWSSPALALATVFGLISVMDAFDLSDRQAMVMFVLAVVVLPLAPQLQGGDVTPTDLALPRLG